VEVVDNDDDVDEAMEWNNFWLLWIGVKAVTSVVALMAITT
jgi:hypothetical protein